MQNAHNGILLTRREALSANFNTQYGGSQELGQAALRAMATFYYGPSRSPAWHEDLSRSCGWGVKGILRGNAERREPFFHIPAEYVEGIAAETLAESCKPTHALELEIEEFVSDAFSMRKGLNLIRE
jgi:hypothetical protein